MEKEITLTSDKIYQAFRLWAERDMSDCKEMVKNWSRQLDMTVDEYAEEATKYFLETLNELNG